MWQAEILLKRIWLCAIILMFQDLYVAYGQDQRVADSLIQLYNSGNYKESEEDILLSIAFNELNPDLKLFYAKKLINRAIAGDSFEYLHKGHLQMGNALREKGDFSTAIESYFSSINYAVKNGDSLGVGKLTISVADTYSEIGNAKNAQVYYAKGISTLRKTNDSISLATALLNAGDDAFNNNLYERALDYFQESGQIFAELEYLIGTAYNLGNIGMVHAESGRDELAESNINQSITILEELEDYYPITVYLTYMSDIYHRKNNFPVALSYAERSRQLATTYGMNNQISEASLKLAELHEGNGDHKTAYGYYREHIIYRDSVKNIEVVQQMADQRTDFEVSQKQAEVDLLNEQKRTQRAVVIGTVIGLVLIAILAVGLFRRNRFIKKTNEIIAAEKDRSENLLLNILPEQTAQELKDHGKVKANKFEEVSVLFTDFKGFTHYSENLEPELLVESVDFYFSKFDAIMEKHGLEKIKTIGDAYMCAAGLPFPAEDHAAKMVDAAMEMLQFVAEAKEYSSNGATRFDIRIGINSGPVVAGVVGTKKFSYDIWGDTVNVAARMESNSEPGKINISENTYQLVKDQFDCSYRGELEAKNRGKLKMYFVNSKLV